MSLTKCQWVKKPQGTIPNTFAYWRNPSRIVGESLAKIHVWDQIAQYNLGLLFILVCIIVLYAFLHFDKLLGKFFKKIKVIKIAVVYYKIS